mmetsp:Transcript_55879/g.127078  ORF Transcript_55879/g.127078 Transcript_55879/m.127078 type:complete len:204 (-) Transcript_55879:2-613(-)
MHGSRSAGASDSQRLRNGPWNLMILMDHEIPLRAWLSDLRGGALLESVSSHRAGGNLSGEHQKRDPISHGIVKRRHQIRQPRPTRDNAHTHFPCSLRRSGGGVPRTLLVGRGVPLDGGVHKCVYQGQHSSPAVPKDLLHTGLDQQAVDQFSAGHLLEAWHWPGGSQAALAVTGPSMVLPGGGCCNHPGHRKTALAAKTNSSIP